MVITFTEENPKLPLLANGKHWKRPPSYTFTLFNYICVSLYLILLLVVVCIKQSCFLPLERNEIKTIVSHAELGGKWIIRLLYRNRKTERRLIRLLYMYREWKRGERAIFYVKSMSYMMMESRTTLNSHLRRQNWTKKQQLNYNCNSNLST